MRNIKLTLAIFFGGIFALWLLATSFPDQWGVYPVRNLMLQLTGAISILAMSACLILAVRPKILETPLGGLDKMYRLLVDCPIQTHRQPAKCHRIRPKSKRQSAFPDPECPEIAGTPSRSIPIFTHTRRKPPLFSHDSTNWPNSLHPTDRLVPC